MTMSSSAVAASSVSTLIVLQNLPYSRVPTRGELWFVYLSHSDDGVFDRLSEAYVSHDQRSDVDVELLVYKLNGRRMVVE